MKTIFTHKSLKHTCEKLASVFVLSAVFFTATAQVSHNISVINTAFDPPSITIDAGDTVIWTNSSGNHNVNGTQATYPGNPESFGNSVGSNWTYSHVFTMAGTYDYQCDPHANLGMKGQVIVMQDAMLTVNFSGMNPHVGQDLWLSVIDKESGEEIGRMEKTVEVDFSIEISGIEVGHSYFVDFFADFNENGQYDAPPTDHAWRLDLDDVDGDETLDFVHNTNFTDIDWKYLLTVQFTGMTPHVGQLLELYLYDTVNEMYVDTVTIGSISTADFDIMSYAIMPGVSYNIDFYADFNENTTYDAPPTDHAWRIELNDVQGDTTIAFAHNVEFTDIMNDGTTGIPDIQTTDDIQIYPNPATSYISLLGNKKLQGNIEVIIYNINGQAILTNNFHKTDKVEIDINTLSKGLYFVKVNTETDNAFIRFIKVD